MGNVGDEAVLSVLLDGLATKGFKPVVLSANPDRTLRLHGVSSCRDKLSVLRFWKEFLELISANFCRRR